MKSGYIKFIRLGYYYDGEGTLEIISKNWRVLLFYPPAFSFIAKYRHIMFTWNVFKKWWFTFNMDNNKGEWIGSRCDK